MAGKKEKLKHMDPIDNKYQDSRFIPNHTNTGVW